MSRGLIVIGFLFLYSITVHSAFRKTLWVWDSDNIVGNSTQENILLNECILTGITDLYLYTAGSVINGTTNQTNTRAFIMKATCNNIQVWGMDGWRGYFSDLCGPSSYYSSIQAVINYNTSCDKFNEKFTGFIGDNEFHVNEPSSGCGVGDVFHSGKSDAQLSTTAGSGLWKSTEKQDRDSLMADFVKQTIKATAQCHNAGLKYGIAVMSWISAISATNAAINYQTTPLYANYGGVNKPLYKHLLDCVDEYVIMSYHTNVLGKVTLMCKDHLTYGNQVVGSKNLAILSALETHCGVAVYVSYCDTPGKDTKSYVKGTAIPDHIDTLGKYPSYAGVSVHDWAGWEGLSPVSANSQTLAVTQCNTTSIADITNISFTVFPNPAEDVVKLLYKNSGQDIEIKLINEIGVLVYIEKINFKEEYVLNISSLKNGFYVLVISDGYKVTHTPLVKN
jgi:hypothetical protein